MGTVVRCFLKAFSHPVFSLFQLRHAEASICGRAQGDPGQRQERVRTGRRGGDPPLHRQELEALLLLQFIIGL
jgi:hypothetical protein